MGVLRSDVSGLYDPEQDHSNRPAGNFADAINSTVDNAIRARQKKRRYGSYSSKGAHSTPATRRLTNRITGERED